MDTADVEIVEHIIGAEWSLTCTTSGCKWVALGERTEDFVEEIDEATRRHRIEHARGRPAPD